MPEVNLFEDKSYKPRILWGPVYQSSSSEEPIKPRATHMSEVYRGVLVKTDEKTAREQFTHLKSDGWLRLAALREDVYGFYNKKGEGTFEELQTVATQLSQVTGVAVVYLYDSRVGFVFEIYEKGELKQSNNNFRDFDNDLKIEPFKALAAADLTDDDVEAAFHWDRGELLI